MKIDRIIGIIYFLINRRCVSAQKLADFFNVSVRTIYRDVTTIGQAGIPIVTYPGSGGGIGFVDGYSLDKSIFTHEELHVISTAVSGLSSVVKDGSLLTAFEKLKLLSGGHAKENQREQIRIDFSPWGMGGVLEKKVTLLKQAISNQRSVLLEYRNAKGEIAEREVESYTLLLKNQCWYLYAFCLLRDEFRLFKLSRIKEMTLLQSNFEQREMEEDEFPWRQEWWGKAPVIKLKLKFDASVRHRAEDFFDAKNVSIDSDGICIVDAAYAESDWIESFVLSFGGSVEVLEPFELRERIKAAADKIREKYMD